MVVESQSSRNCNRCCDGCDITGLIAPSDSVSYAVHCSLLCHTVLIRCTLH